MCVYIYIALPPEALQLELRVKAIILSLWPLLMETNLHLVENFTLVRGEERMKKIQSTVIVAVVWFRGTLFAFLRYGALRRRRGNDSQITVAAPVKGSAPLNRPLYLRV